MARTVLLLLLMAPLAARAQTIERQVLGAAGGSMTAGGILHAYTVGEPCTTPLWDGELYLTQGFHQTAGFSVLIADAMNGMELRAFPNPTRNAVHLELTANAHRLVDVTVHDALGKWVMASPTLATGPGIARSTVDLSAFAAGTYIIRLLDSEGAWTRSIRVEKLH